jgi:hypothetical protein
MIEVFKTDVQEFTQANNLLALLSRHFPGNRINFDLEDCDKVLRVEGNNIQVEKLMDIIQDHGFSCVPLE